MAPSRKAPNAVGIKENGHKDNTTVPGKRVGNTSILVKPADKGLRESMTDLSIQGSDNTARRPIAHTEIGSTTQPKLKFDDEQTHVSVSSVKPGSLDGKSTASGITFAMDEKESIRPDDSASVKAAEEEDSCSGNGSGVPNSRIGSEAGGRAFRDQFNEISERIGYVPGHPNPVDHGGIPGIKEEVTSRPASPLQRPLEISVAPAKSSDTPFNGSFFQMEYRDPDEKLLEALESPKDRLFVLRLEHEIVNFIQHPGDQTLDLKTPNSFCRLLAHKLADYYALTHHVDGGLTAVRLYRTPYCRIRTPLSSYSPSNANNDSTLPTQPAVKIMRRAGLVKDGRRPDSGPNTTDFPIAPSKAGSETGDDSGRATGLVSPTESNLSKDRLTMTREEREAKYKETRDRIFKGFDDSENADIATGNETGLGISRSNSVNGRKKVRKQRNNDDGFEARSHYTPYYPPMHYPGPPFEQTPASPVHFNPNMPQQYPAPGDPGSINPTLFQPIYGSGYQPLLNTPAYPGAVQQYPMTNSPSPNDINNPQPFPGYMQQIPYPYYQQPQSSPAFGQNSPSISSPALSSSGQFMGPQSQPSEQQWPSVSYQYPYQYQYPQPRSQPPYYPPQSQSNPQAIPYQYGQLPCPPNLPGSRNAHPLPGSYNRQQALNPQIRSFVPGSSPNPGSVGSMVPDGSLFQQYPNSSGNTSGLAPSAPSSHAMHAPAMPQFGSFTSTPEPKSIPSRKSHGNAAESHVSAKSTLAKWRTPANLPPKPPPPDPPSLPEGRHSLPQSVPAPPSLSKAVNGQHVPALSNGLGSSTGANER
ncbi:MAG: hypothetical protein Q9219_001993 [cf. Caloplaca sp. 3 TL-2023]